MSDGMKVIRVETCADDRRCVKPEEPLALGVSHQVHTCILNFIVDLRIWLAEISLA
jgi:hypothetical protein